MKILGLIPNQWNQNSRKLRDVYSKLPRERWHELNKTLLFTRVNTRDRLYQTFGQKLCEAIVWEHVSPGITDKPYAFRQVDPEHIEGMILHHHPDLILAFGRKAHAAVLGLSYIMKRTHWIILLKDPCSDDPHILERLSNCAERIREIEKEAIFGIDCKMLNI